MATFLISALKPALPSLKTSIPDLSPTEFDKIKQAISQKAGRLNWENVTMNDFITVIESFLIRLYKDYQQTQKLKEPTGGIN